MRHCIDLNLRRPFENARYFTSIWAPTMYLWHYSDGYSICKTWKIVCYVYVMPIHSTWWYIFIAISFLQKRCNMISNKTLYMMTSPNGNIFRVTGHLCGEFTCLRWIPRTKASDGGALMFSLIYNWCLKKVEKIIVRLVIWDATNYDVIVMYTPKHDFMFYCRTTFFAVTRSKTLLSKAKM